MPRRLSILLLGAALLLAAPLRGQTSVPLHLNRYGQEAVTGPVKVVFIGDSITDGWPKKHAAFFDGTAASLLRRCCVALRRCVAATSPLHRCCVAPRY